MTSAAVGEGDAFPRLIECPERGLEPGEAPIWVGARCEALLAEAALHGAVLLRGLPLETAEDFDACVAAFGLGSFRYRESLSNAVRVEVTERVFTANEAPPEATIGLHHELAQTPVHPSRLFFFCEKPAERGGATSLCRSDHLYERLRSEEPGFLADAETHGLVYSHVMPPEDDPASALGRSWRGTLGIETRDAAERKLASLSYSWEWNADGSLRATSRVLPAVRDLGDGRRSFFNQLIATRGWKDARNDPVRALRLGNGAPVDLELRSRIADLAEEISADASWERGDVALVDNHVVMHGRRSFVGTRRVLASFSAAS